MNTNNHHHTNHQHQHHHHHEQQQPNDQDTITFFPDPTKYLSLNLSHCTLSPHFPKKSSFDFKNQQNQHQQNRQQRRQHFDGQWYLTVHCKNTFKPIITTSTTTSTNHHNDHDHPYQIVNGQSLFPVMSCHPIIDYSDENDNDDNDHKSYKPILTYRKQSHLIGLSSDLLLIDRMQYIALQLVQFQKHHQNQHQKNQHQRNELFQIKYMTHSLIAVSYGFEYEFDSYVTYSLDEQQQAYKVQFSPSLYELVPLINSQFNQSFIDQSSSSSLVVGEINNSPTTGGVKMDMIKKWITTLHMICSPMLLLKQVIHAHGLRSLWFIIPRSLSHWRVLYYNNKYEFSIHLLSNGKLVIVEVPYDHLPSSSSSASASANGGADVTTRDLFHREITLSPLLSTATMATTHESLGTGADIGAGVVDQQQPTEEQDERIVIKHRVLECMRQMKQYAISLEIFNWFHQVKCPPSKSSSSSSSSTTTTDDDKSTVTAAKVTDDDGKRLSTVFKSQSLDTFFKVHISNDVVQLSVVGPLSSSSSSSSSSTQESTSSSSTTFSEKQAEFISRHLFGEKVVHVLCNSSLTTFTAYNPLLIFDLLITKYPFSALQQVLQVLMDHRPENSEREDGALSSSSSNGGGSGGASDIVLVMTDDEEEDEVQEVTFPSSSSNSTGSNKDEEKKKEAPPRQLYCEMQLVWPSTPNHGLRLPRHYQYSQPEDDFIVLRFARRTLPEVSSSKSDEAKVEEEQNKDLDGDEEMEQKGSGGLELTHVDVPFSVRYDVASGSFQVTGPSFVNNIQIDEQQQENFPVNNKLYSLVNHMCHMSLHDIYNLQ